MNKNNKAYEEYLKKHMNRIEIKREPSKGYSYLIVKREKNG